MTQGSVAETSKRGTADSLGLCWSWAGEELVLLPSGAVWWPRQETVLIADPHFGKAATFRATAIPIPDGTEHDLLRLTKVLRETAARRLIILGDLLHARRGRCPTTFAAVTQWREERAEVELVLVRGNHDLGAGDPPAEWNIACLPEPWLCEPFVLQHHDTPAGRPALAGHRHPKIRLSAGGDQLQLPCFHWRDELLVLPAWTEFADSGLIRRSTGDRVFVLAGEAVVEV